MPAQGQTKRKTTVQVTGKPVKRTRVSRACDQCRLAREKCDGLQPTCSTCANQNRQCAYTTNPKKRGIQPGYIRSLELALAWLFQLNPENEQLLNDHLAQDGSASVFLSRDSKESNRLHKRWRKATFYSDVDKLLSGGEPSRHENAEPHSPGSESEDDSDDAHFNSSKPLQSSRTSLPQGGLSTTAETSCLHQPSDRQASELKSKSLVLPSDSWSLLETYFTYTQSWLPISEKYDVLKLSYAYPVDGLQLSTNNQDAGSHAELWSILAVASLHDIAEPKRPVEQDVLYEAAKSLIPDELGRFDLGHVKAMLNLTVFNVARGREEAARLLLGLATRILEAVDHVDLGLNTRRKHVFAGCFLLDSLLAARLDRQPYFRISDIQGLSQIDEDGLEEWQPWTGNSSLSDSVRTPMLALSLFNRLLDLVDILVSATSISSHETFQNDLERLTSWESALPPKLAYIRSESAPTHVNPPSALVQLTYHCTCFILKRSKSELKRFLEILEICQIQIGPCQIPPIIRALSELVRKHTSSSVHGDQSRHQNLTLDVSSPYSRMSTIEARSKSNPQLVSQNLNAQIPTPESVQNFLPMLQSLDQSLAVRSVDHNLVYLDDPGLSTSIITHADKITQPASASDPRYPEIDSDLDNFFDELATIDNGTRAENQPQFMQNLGFAPDANMSDLFGEYISLQSSAFLPVDETAPVVFDQFNIYDT